MNQKLKQSIQEYEDEKNQKIGRMIFFPEPTMEALAIRGINSRLAEAAYRLSIGDHRGGADILCVDP